MSESGLEYPETTFYSFDKPLTPLKERKLALLMERYVDEEGRPLVKWDSNPDDPNEGFIALHIPRVLRMKAYAHLEAKAPSLHGVPSNG